MPLFARLFRAALLTGTATASLACAAQAASFTVTGTDTVAKTVAGPDIGTINVGGVLSGANPITWALNTNNTTPVTINNSGTITGTTRGIDTSSNASGGARSFSFNNLTAGASLIGIGDAFRVNKDIGAGTLAVDNFGTIQSTGLTGSTNGQAIDFDAVSTTTGHVIITNESTGLITAADADAIRPGNSSTINNHGQIIGASTGDSGNDGIDFQSANSGTVNNFLGGAITGARHGITGDLNQTIVNSGTILGQAGSGINLDTLTGTSTITNNATGVITGTANGVDGDGIDVDHLVSITNAGKIQALGTFAGDLNEAITVGGGTITNLAGGTIISSQRAITVDNSALGPAFGVTTIDNTGTITGQSGEAININSTFADSLTNRSGGAINGSVTMSAGDNAITLYAGSTLNGALDGGAGNDTIHLTGTGKGALSNVSNVEKLSVESATWTLSGGQSYSGGVTVAAGATAQVSGALFGNITNNGTIAVAGGSAQFNGTFQNNGAYISDPSTQSFVTLSVGANGFIQAAPGDRYQVGADFLSVSNQNKLWDTGTAILEFTGPGSHTLDVTGVNQGAFANTSFDFGWGTLDVDSGVNLFLADSLGSGNAAFYISGDLVGAQIAGNLVTNMFGVSGLTVFYNKDDPNNAYLGGLSYNLTNGGKLVAAVPEPITLSLFGTGLVGAMVLRRKKRRA